MNEDVKSENLRIHSRADELIACLEGEIAKRDARIVELESDLAGTQSRVLSLQDQWRKLDAELAALKAQDTVGEVVGWYRLDRPYEMTPYPSVCATWHKLGAPVAPLYAAPVSEAKAQGVIDFVFSGELPNATFVEVEDGNGNSINVGEWLKRDDGYSVLRLAAAPVQQVIVPDGYVLADKKALGTVLQALVNAPHHIRELQVTRTPVDMFSDNPINVLIANYAAPAAPAADAGLVDMYRHLQTVTPYRFKKIQDASVTDGGDVLYFHKDRFDAALLADMAAHCAAKGVV